MVFSAMTGDFMKPRIKEVIMKMFKTKIFIPVPKIHLLSITFDMYRVLLLQVDELLAKGVNVTVYNGQVFFQIMKNTLHNQ